MGEMKEGERSNQKQRILKRLAWIVIIVSGNVTARNKLNIVKNIQDENSVSSHPHTEQIQREPGPNASGRQLLRDKEEKNAVWTPLGHRARLECEQ